MKIFVGTMHCGEGDFEMSKRWVEQQQNVEVTHKIISDLPEPEAHRQLYAAWEEARATHDVFVKIDADTVLIADDTLETIGSLFKANDRLTGVQCSLNDYFTNSLIFGLNAYSPKIKLLSPDNDLYPDRIDPPHIHDVVLRGEQLPTSLQPAGYHCHFSNDAQSFHYGLHRALKNKVDELSRVNAVWQQLHDRARGLALMGAKIAPRFRAESLGFNYADQTFKDALEAAIWAYEHKSPAPR